MADRDAALPDRDAALPERNHELPFEDQLDVRSSLSTKGVSSDRVNRTHRVVRERAKTLAARRSKIRSLWLPVVIFSALLIAICFAVWMVLDEYEIVAAGSQVASYQVMVPVLWSIPVSAALIAVVWFRQSRTDAVSRGSF